MKLFIILLALTFTASADFSVQKKFLERYCYDCHDTDTSKGGIDVEDSLTDWSNPKTGFFWDTIYRSIKDGYMPPAKKKKQPTKEEREEMLSSLHNSMVKNLTAGGTVLRRLNKTEYKNTIRDVFGLKFKMPETFPSDKVSHGFDNNGDKLQISSTLMMQYFKVSRMVTDQLFRVPELPDVKPVNLRIYGDFQLWMSLDWVVWGNANMYGHRVPATGIYEVEYDLDYFWKQGARFPKNTEPLSMKVFAFGEGIDFNGGMKQMRLLDSFKYDPTKKEIFKKKYKLNKYERLCFRWDDSPIKNKANPPYTSRYQKFDIDMAIIDKMFEDQKFRAAFNTFWKKPRGVDTKRLYYIVSKKYNDKNFNYKDPSLQNKRFMDYNVPRGHIRDYLKGETKNLGPHVKLKVNRFYGPVKAEQTTETERNIKLKQRLMGERGNLDNESYLKQILTPLITKLFRKPASEEEVNHYTGIALKYIEKGEHLEQGLSASVRAILCSTKFIYRATTPGKLSEYELASRLSYFLWGTTPDPILLGLATQGKLSDPEVLETQVKRLIKSRRSNVFIKRFTGQWLQIDKLDFITPDDRLIKKFSPELLQAFKDETRFLFKEIMHRNMKMENFIVPNFAYISKESAELIYNYKAKNLGVDVSRIKIKRDGVMGGLLTQGAIMMATANGVDTQPILRGVWMLENILGDHLPSPPSDVPALQDIKGQISGKAQSVREKVEAHTTNPSCASCHVKIDPLGFVFENFDPIG
ncbi:MAG: DUF1592 domain-containing protein, partial [Lentisphaeraceae bacterium]|nr:DUF1592 domain-containing protein [Lentisphaeraceae bacterium]